MHSTELARLADVTVRTLRHYHQVGVLPEPERGSNGYRDYTVLDLVRLLRIKRLGALGIPLEAMNALLDGESRSEDELLDRLDRDLDAEIERLRAQQVLVRLIRSNNAAPDFPPEFARFFALLEASQSSTAIGRGEAVLLAHLAGTAGVQRLTEVYERMADSLTGAAVSDYSEDFESLPPDADDSTIDELVERFVAGVAPVIANLDDSTDGMLADEAAATAMFNDYYRSTLNPAQFTAISRLIARLG